MILELDETKQYHDNWKIPEYSKYSENPPQDNKAIAETLSLRHRAEEPRDLAT